MKLNRAEACHSANMHVRVKSIARARMRDYNAASWCTCIRVHSCAFVPSCAFRSNSLLCARRTARQLCVMVAMLHGCYGTYLPLAGASSWMRRFTPVDHAATSEVCRCANVRWTPFAVSYLSSVMTSSVMTSSSSVYRQLTVFYAVGR